MADGDDFGVAAYWEGNAETWTRQVRAGFDIYRDALNPPRFLAMLPGVAGRDGIDLGCGEGANTRAVARLGARMLGIDIAPTFIRHAREAEAATPLGIAYRQGDARRLDLPDASTDFVTAFMSLMDMPQPEQVLAEAARVLRPGGFLQFSILHPCFVPPHRRVLRDDGGTVSAIEVAGYFAATEGQVDRWWFGSLPPDQRAAVAPFAVPRFHRTLGDWVGLIVAAGLAIEAMAEPCATPAEAAAEPVIADTRVAPLVLMVRARRPL